MRWVFALCLTKAVYLFTGYRTYQVPIHLMGHLSVIFPRTYSSAGFWWSSFDAFPLTVGATKIRPFLDQLSFSSSPSSPLAVPLLT